MQLGSMHISIYILVYRDVTVIPNTNIEFPIPPQHYIQLLLMTHSKIHVKKVHVKKMGTSTQICMSIIKG